MDNRWADYSFLPANGEDFERYVGTILEDLGYGVSLTPAANDYGVDLIVHESISNRRIAVQAKFFNGGSLGNGPIQEVVAGMPYWGADAGWVITNAADFTENARRLAQANGVYLVSNRELNDLVAQAVSLRSLEPCGGSAASAQSGDGSGLGGQQGAAAYSQPTQLAYSVQPGASGSAPLASQPPAASELPAVSAASPQKVYNFTDVKTRWNCSDGYLREQMRRGLPLCKQPNGRYAIAERDLVGWEQAMATDAKRRRRNRLIRNIVGLLVALILIVALVVFWPHITEAIESTFPGVHVLTWEELWEKLPWSQQG